MLEEKLRICAWPCNILHLCYSLGDNSCQSVTLNYNVYTHVLKGQVIQATFSLNLIVGLQVDATVTQV